MVRNGKAVVLTLATLCVAGCAKSDFVSVRQHKKVWVPVEAKTVAGARDAVPPRILPETYFAAGRLLESQGLFGQAVTQYRKAVAVNHNYAEAYYRLGLLLSAAGRHAEAIEAFRKTVHLKPDNALAQNDLGFESMFVKDWEYAERQFRRAIELEPGFSRAHVNLGMVLSRLGHFDEALESFRAVLPDSDAYYNMGLMYRGQKHYSEAANAFRQTLDIDPMFTAATTQLERLAIHLHPETPAQPIAHDIPAEPGVEQIAEIDVPPVAPQEAVLPPIPHEPDVVITDEAQVVDTAPVAGQERPVIEGPFADAFSDELEGPSLADFFPMTRAPGEIPLVLLGREFVPVQPEPAPEIASPPSRPTEEPFVVVEGATTEDDQPFEDAHPPVAIAREFRATTDHRFEDAMGPTVQAVVDVPIEQPVPPESRAAISPAVDEYWPTPEDDPCVEELVQSGDFDITAKPAIVGPEFAARDDAPVGVVHDDHIDTDTPFFADADTDSDFHPGQGFPAVEITEVVDAAPFFTVPAPTIEENPFAAPQAPLPPEFPFTHDAIAPVASIDRIARLTELEHELAHVRAEIDCWEVTLFDTIRAAQPARRIHDHRPTLASEVEPEDSDQAPTVAPPKADQTDNAIPISQAVDTDAEAAAIEPAQLATADAPQDDAEAPLDWWFDQLFVYADTPTEPTPRPGAVVDEEVVAAGPVTGHPSDKPYLVRDVWWEPLADPGEKQPPITERVVLPATIELLPDWPADFGELEDLLSIIQNEARCWAELDAETEFFDSLDGDLTGELPPSLPFDALVDIIGNFAPQTAPVDKSVETPTESPRK